MKLKFVVPDVEKTFGNLEYAGEGEVKRQRVNGAIKVISRTYNVYSEIQRADDVSVVLPASAGDKLFEPDDRVRLVNPRIIAEGRKIGNKGYANYILLADDLVKV